MNRELISVILPIYCVEKYLPICIEALINQTYKNLEIILVDDGSPDNCPIICDEYASKDSRIKVIHKENGGVSSARNAGLKKSNGKYIYFMDPDDLISNRFLECMYYTMIKEDCDIVVCNFTSDEEEFYNGTQQITCSNKETVDQTNLIQQIMFTPNIAGYAWNKLLKRSVIGELLFDESIHINEDQLFILQYASRVRKAILIKEKLYYYRVLENSAMKQKWNDRKASAFVAYLMIVKLLNECIFPNEQIQKYAGSHATYLAINYFSIIHQVTDKLYWKKKLSDIYAQLTAYGKPRYTSYKEIIKALPYELWFWITH